LPFPELTGYNSRDEPLPDFQQALLLYYLVTADGAPLTGRWVSFADLPDGRMYDTAFQGTAAMRLSKGLAWIWIRSSRLVQKQAGNFVEIGSASFIFQALPRVPLMVDLLARR
jgi:hypothetical protein